MLLKFIVNWSNNAFFLYKKYMEFFNAKLYVSSLILQFESYVFFAFKVTTYTRKTWSFME